MGMMGKLPIITALFWVMKILATTLGETGGDVVGQTLNLGYLAGALIFVAFLVVVLGAQLRAHKFHSALFWSVIVATSLVGTEISDFMNRTEKLGYAGGALVLITALLIVLGVWRFSGETMKVDRIDSFRGELFYWIATLISNTLGTSTGDYLAHKEGLGVGYVTGTFIIGVALVALAAAHYLTPFSGTVLFWIAYVITRPLGANLGNTLSKTHDEGGLALGTIGASAILAGLLIIGIGYQLFTSRPQTPALAGGAAPTPHTAGGNPAGGDRIYPDAVAVERAVNHPDSPGPARYRR